MSTRTLTSTSILCGEMAVGSNSDVMMVVATSCWSSPVKSAGQCPLPDADVRTSSYVLNRVILYHAATARWGPQVAVVSGLA